MHGVCWVGQNCSAVGSKWGSRLDLPCWLVLVGCGARRSEQDLFLKYISSIKKYMAGFMLYAVLPCQGHAVQNSGGGEGEGVGVSLAILCHATPVCKNILTKISPSFLIT